MYDADIDGDGDPDVVATAYVKGYVVWFENHLPDDWEWHTIDDNLVGANDLCTADVDGDGKLDVIATGRISYDLIWYENVIIGDVEPLSDILPTSYALYQNYPNPFNPTASIKYQIPELSFVTIKVYDILGNEIASLVNEEKPAGSYKVQFDGGNLTSGIYFYQLRAGNFVETKKMLLMK